MKYTINNTDIKLMLIYTTGFFTKFNIVIESLSLDLFITITLNKSVNWYRVYTEQTV